MYTVKATYGSTIKYINGRRTKNRIDGTITVGKNLVPSAIFNIYPDNEGYSIMHAYQTKIRIYTADGNKVFSGRVINVQPSLDTSGIFCKQITVEGVLGYLNDSIAPETVYPDHYRAQCIKYMVENHNLQVEEYKQFNTTVIQEQILIDYRAKEKQTLEMMLDDSVTGADNSTAQEYTYEAIETEENAKLTLEYVHPVTNANEKIEFRRNLKSIDIQVNYSDLCTRVIPLNSDGYAAYDSWEGNSNVVDAPSSVTAKFGIIAKYHKFENFTKRGSSLISKGRTWLNKQQTIVKSFSIDAVNLYSIGLDAADFSLYKKYRTICEPLGIDEWVECIQITRNLNDPADVKLTFGERKYLLSKVKN